MSFGNAMKAIGRGAGLNQAREFRRQNEQDKMRSEEHGKRMQALDTNLELGEMQVDQTRTQMKRDDLAYKDQQRLLETKRAFDIGTLKLATEGDPSGLISAYNQFIRDGDTIIGFETVEGKDGETQYKLKFREGGEKVLDRQALGGIGKALSNPDMILQIEENRRQELAEKEEQIAAERRGIEGDKEIISHRADENIRVAKETAIPVEGEGDQRKTGPSNYFKSYLGSLFGGKFNEFGGMILPEGSEQMMVEATAIAERAAAQNPEMVFADAAMIGYSAVKGELSQEEARKAAREEYESRRAAARENGEQFNVERDSYIKDRAEGLIEQSRWAQRYVREHGLDQISGSKRPSAIDAQQPPSQSDESPDVFSYIEP